MESPPLPPALDPRALGAAVRRRLGSGVEGGVRLRGAEPFVLPGEEA